MVIPDLLVKGQYPGDAVQRGEGGLENKASRYPKGWQSHGPRSGWFAVVQVHLDERVDVAAHDLDPTAVQAVLVAKLALEDWSWQPAREGRIRSGTASVRSSGTAKLRAGAVWVAPEYRPAHNRLTAEAKLGVLRDELPGLVAVQLRESGAATVDQLTASIGPSRGITEAALRPRIQAALRKLRLENKVRLDTDGQFAVVE